MVYENLSFRPVQRVPESVDVDGSSLSVLACFIVDTSFSLRLWLSNLVAMTSSRREIRASYAWMPKSDIDASDCAIVRMTIGKEARYRIAR